MEKYLEDLNYLIKMLECNHLDIYFNVSKSDLNNYINYIKENILINNDYQFMYIIKKVIKKLSGIYDSHTRAMFQNNKLLPIKIKVIKDKVYIIKTLDEYKNICYSEITHINGISMNNLISELEETISYSTREWLIKNIQDDLIKFNSLKMLPSIGDAYSIDLTIKKNNNINSIKFDCNKDYQKITNDDKNYTFEIIDDVLKINYTSCIEKKKNQMLDFINDINTNVNNRIINDVVVDLRGNVGGNDTIIKPLLEYLKNNFTNIYSLQDGGIFSGGRFALFDLKNIGSRTIGTNIGTQANCFGNLKKFNDKSYFELPNTKFKITCSTRFYYLDNGLIKFTSDKKELSILKKNKKILEPIYFEPDYYVEEDINDYKQGIDSYMEQFKEIKNLKIK